MSDGRIILSYHIFGDEPNEYKFSRTYDQFAHDIDKKVYDEIHIDDARICTIRACDMLRGSNRRAKVFVCTELVGKEGFCSWDDLKALSRFHDIECHGKFHRDHSLMTYQQQAKSISYSKEMISAMIRRPPRFFVGPYNQFNTDTERICKELDLHLVYGRINITNFYK